MHDRMIIFLQNRHRCDRVMLIFGKVRENSVLRHSVFALEFHETRHVDKRSDGMDPIMCPFCGGTNLFQEDDFGLEMDYEYWTVHHWECLECAQSFDKIEVLPASNAFEEMNESTIH